MAINLQIGHASHVGLEREVNEDSYLALAPPAASPPVDALLLVADGVGGANAGEVASGLLVESFLGWFANNRYAENVHYNPEHADYFIAALKDLLENVNQRLYQTAATRPEWSSMGTTATVALFSNNRVFVGHVGDTRAYMLRGGVLSQLTADHSWVAEEVAAGRMTEAQAQTHPRRNVISRVLGTSPLLRVDRQAYDVLPDDIFILASDGLTGLVAGEEIRATILGARSLQDACHGLIALANQRGGHDNITVLIGRALPADSRLQGATAGVGPDGVAVHSVYMGRAAPAAANGSPAARKKGGRAKDVTTVGQAAPAPGPRRDWGRAGAALLLLVAVAAAAAALAMGAFAAVRDGTDLTVAGLTLTVPLVAGLIAVVAVLIGFLIGYLGRQWLVESRDTHRRESNS